MRNGGFEPSGGYIRVRPAIGGHAGFHGRQGRCFVEKYGSAALHGEAATRASVMGVRRCQVSVTLTGAHVLLQTFGEHHMMTGAATHESAALRRLVAFMQRDEDEARGKSAGCIGGGAQASGNST